MITSEISPEILAKLARNKIPLEARLRAVLSRRHPGSLLDWSLAHRWFNEVPMRLSRWMEAIYRDRHPYIAVEKGVQLGASEWLINEALWCADTRHAGRGNSLYVMPTQAYVTDLVQGRVDPAIENSEHLRALMEWGQGKPPNNVRVKRLGGGGYIYFRGAEVERQLTTVDVDLVLLDELDYMNARTLEIARRRLSSSKSPLIRAVSTPTLPDHGIDALFLESDRRRWLLKCGHCGEWQDLKWESNVDLERIALVCCKCRQTLDVAGMGEWVPEREGQFEIHGYHLSGLLNPRLDLRRLISASLAADHSSLQQFYNSDLGVSYVPPGGFLSMRDLDACCRPGLYLATQVSDCNMGVDVGTKLHVVIREKRDGRYVLVAVLVVDNFEDLEPLMRIYDVKSCVIDASPDLRKALEFARQHPRDVLLCYYGRKNRDHDWSQEGEVHANRTVALDETFSRFREGINLLPENGRDLIPPEVGGCGEYFRQLMAPVRVIKEGPDGNPESTYDNRSKADHFAHAEVYCTLASQNPDRYEPYEYLHL